MSALNTQKPTILSTEQVIVNHISVQAATVITGYNAQYLRRLLRARKLEGVKVGQVWLVKLDSLQEYFGIALSSNDLRYGPKGVWQPPSKCGYWILKARVYTCKRSVYTIVSKRILWL